MSLLFFSACCIKIIVFIYTPKMSAKSHALLIEVFRYFLASS